MVKATEARKYTALVLEPAHFHGALLFRQSQPLLHDEIHVFAPDNAQTNAFSTLIERFNQRAEMPTRWRLHYHFEPSGGSYTDALLAQRAKSAERDAVILANQNHQKLAAISALSGAGFAVLADKPWLTCASQLPLLGAALKHPVALADVMTCRHQLLSRLSQAVANTPALFGSIETVQIRSIHHLCKQVNGRALQRPVWYYDPSVQGDGLVDIQSHMVEQALWWIIGDRRCDYATDVSAVRARRSATLVPLEVFAESTGVSAWPKSLRHLVDEDLLAYPCNGEIDYRLADTAVTQTAEWRLREPPGGGDMHQVDIIGSESRLQIRQGPRTGFEPNIELLSDHSRVFARELPKALEIWREQFEGLTAEPIEGGVKLCPPAHLDHGHESHFPLVMSEFLANLPGPISAPQSDRIRLRYTLLAKAQSIALRHE